jgi:hypothetical protein
MASRWYVDQDGEQIGPLKTVELRQLAARGDVQSQTPVRRGEQGDWVPAGKVVGLIPKSSQAAALQAQAVPVARAVPTARPVAQPVAAAAPAPAPTPSAPAIKAAAPQTRQRSSRRPRDVPFSLAAGMLVVLLLAASLGVAGVFISVWRAGEEAAGPEGEQAADRPAVKGAATPQSEALSPDLRDDALLQAIDRWHDAQRMRVGPRQTARYQVASARLVTPAELEQLSRPHVVRKEEPVAPSSSLPAAVSHDDVDVDPSFDDPLAATPADAEETSAAPGSPSRPSSLPPASGSSASSSPAVVEDAPAEPKLLVVELRVTNLSPQEALHYDGLNGFSKEETAALLVDDLGKRFLPLPPSEASTLRRVDQFEIAPGHTLTDVLVFPAPEAGFEYLRLALPNASIGASGGIGFEIRREMIDKSGPLDPGLAQVDPPNAPELPAESPVKSSPAESPAVKPAPIKPDRKNASTDAADGSDAPTVKSPKTFKDLRDSISRSLGDSKEKE